MIIDWLGGFDGIEERGWEVRDILECCEEAKRIGKSLPWASFFECGPCLSAESGVCEPDVQLYAGVRREFSQCESSWTRGYQLATFKCTAISWISGTVACNCKTNDNGRWDTTPGGSGGKGESTPGASNPAAPSSPGPGAGAGKTLGPGELPPGFVPPGTKPEPAKPSTPGAGEPAPIPPKKVKRWGCGNRGEPPPEYKGPVTYESFSPDPFGSTMNVLMGTSGCSSDELEDGLGAINNEDVGSTSNTACSCCDGGRNGCCKGGCAVDAPSGMSDFSLGDSSVVFLPTGAGVYSDWTDRIADNVICTLDVVEVSGMTLTVRAPFKMTA